LFMPLSGEVVEVNTSLDETPEAVNDEPYASGWMIKIKMDDPEEVSQLLTADQYKQLISG